MTRKNKTKIDTRVDYKNKEDLFINSRVMACNTIIKKENQFLLQIKIVETL